ncbi:MAG: fasciclin domain-containing protein [Pricia sp.]
MKKRTFKLFATFIGTMILSLNVSAQSANEQILAGVESPGDYETIQLAQMDSNLSTFMNLVALSDFGASWKLTDEEHTVFIPTNQAFDEMSVEKYTHLTDPENKADLVRFVKYHFLPSKATQTDFDNADIIDTQSEDKITVTMDGTFGTVYVGGAKVIKSMEASDGVVHIVNGVVNPNEEFLMLN